MLYLTKTFLIIIVFCENHDILVIIHFALTFSLRCLGVKLIISVKSHVKSIHEGIKQHVCDKCDSAFSRPHDLKRHTETVHEGLKRYLCDKCDKAFTQQKHLKRHVESVHLGLREHVCDRCSKAFSGM